LNQSGHLSNEVVFIIALVQRSGHHFNKTKNNSNHHNLLLRCVFPIVLNVLSQQKELKN